jgi:hypothetical protein
VQKTNHRDPKRKFKGDMMGFEMLERREKVSFRFSNNNYDFKWFGMKKNDLR